MQTEMTYDEFQTYTATRKTCWADHCNPVRADDGTWGLWVYGYVFHTGKREDGYRLAKAGITEADLLEAIEDQDRAVSLRHAVAMRPTYHFTTAHDPREMGIHPDR